MRCIAYRPASLFNKARIFALEKLNLLSTLATAAKPKFSFDDDDSEEGSAVYKHVLKFQRPSKVKFEDHLYNSASFIGFVENPLRLYENFDDLRVYTNIRINNFSQSNRPLRLLVEMRDKLAATALIHVKPRDFIYVSGHLDFYVKTVEDEMLKTYYKVIAKEFKFVAERPHVSTHQDCKNSQFSIDGGGFELQKKQLYLWHLYFSNPFEWWDNRKTKKGQRHPDFRHKDTGESLWLRADDPPWVKQQLQLLDSKISQGLGEHMRSRARVSTWVYDE